MSCTCLVSVQRAAGWAHAGEAVREPGTPSVLGVHPPPRTLAPWPQTMAEEGLVLVLAMSIDKGLQSHRLTCPINNGAGK